MRPLAAVAVVTVLASCGGALTSKAPPLDVHYVTVDVTRTTTTRSAVASAPRAVAIGRVRSSEFLRNRLVYREANHVLGTYDTWRWTEYPEAYLRRSLSRALFDDARFAESLRADGLTLDVELVAFEEVRRAGARAARVQVDYRLRAGDRVLASDAVAVERGVPAEGGVPPVVDALEGALSEVTAKIAAAVDAASARGEPRTR